MDVLNGSTLLKAFRTCDENDGAKVGIACASNASAQELINLFWDTISSNKMPGWEIGRAVDAAYATVKKKGRTEYSTIEIFPALSWWGIRGRSYHFVLYEEYLGSDLIAELSGCERLSFDATEDAGSELLDEFLNSFKIV